MRILHIAPQNVAGVPITFVRAERALGHESRLVTMYRDPRGYEEDVCLDLPLFDSRLVRTAKRWVAPRHRRTVTHRSAWPRELPPVWRPGKIELFLIRFREMLWKPRVERALAALGADSFDVIQFDGGLDFYRDGRNALRWKALGKRIVCCYTGSDLRTRGIVPAVDSLADLRVTVEYDHKWIYPGIHHLFFPFEPERMPPRRPPRDGRVRIGHAPSARQAKGTEHILRELHQLQRRHPNVEIVLIEGLPHAEALRKKAVCDIFVDQIGDLGYGINSLESLAMGIPTASSLAPGFAQEYPDHPFVDVSDGNVAEKLEPLVKDAELREHLGRRGRDWVRQYHDARRVVERLHTLLRGES